MVKDFENILLRHLGFPPTADQSRAINVLARFVFSLNSQVGMILKGYAGTGKTSLIGALVKSLDEEKKKVVLLAPTGRAAKVLSKHSGKDAMTIHKRIYFQKPSGGKVIYTLGKNLHKNTIFIIDEASMIASETQSENFGANDLLDDLLRFVYNGFNCKLIFIGDTAQLPPVGSPYSPALEKQFLEGAYDISFGVVHLRNVVRQTEDSGILYNATNLRIQMLENNCKIKLHANNRDALWIDGYILQDELESTISKHGVENVIVICRSNKRSNLFNQQIRHRILYHEEQINSGDLMMVLKNNYHWIDEPTRKMSFIANGDTIEILRIVRFEELYGFHFADVTVRFVDFPDEPEFECKIILDAIMTNSAALSWEQQNALFSAIEEDFSDIANKKKRMAMIMKTPHYNALQVKFAYSVTCHKAQGGQWPVVFIDQGFLPPNGIDVEYMRWLYTAITRATEKLYFVNFSNQFLA